MNEPQATTGRNATNDGPLFVVTRGQDGLYSYRAPVKLGSLATIGTSSGFVWREDAERAAARDARQQRATQK